MQISFNQWRIQRKKGRILVEKIWKNGIFHKIFGRTHKCKKKSHQFGIFLNSPFSTWEIFRCISQKKNSTISTILGVPPREIFKYLDALESNEDYVLKKLGKKLPKISVTWFFWKFSKFWQFSANRCSIFI